MLLRISGENVYKMPAPFVADLLLGTPGTEVELWVIRPGRENGREGEEDGEVKDSSSSPRSMYGTHKLVVTRKPTEQGVAKEAIQQAFSDSRKHSTVTI